jgi:phosphinothricin acetyltransferase
MDTATATVRDAKASDAAAIVAIYNPYIADTAISFELDPVDIDEMAGRMATVERASLPWLVVERQARIDGYAYATPWRTRPAYRGAVETTVYLAPSACGLGLGRQRYRALLDALAQRGFHTAIGGIALPNTASVAMHEALGFRQVAQFAEVGCKFGRHIDVGYWQRHLQEAACD